ncbi:MAG: hypothetical protein ACRDWY_14400 [Actinomycetes bacterium]
MKRRIVIVFAIAVLSACSSSTDSSDAPESPAGPSPTPTEPQTLKGVRAFAKEAADRFGAQDYAGSWDQWNKAGKAAIPRAEYVKYAETCDLGGAPLKVDDIRMEGDSRAVVRYEFAGFKQARTFIYEDGHWRTKVTNETLNLFKNGGKAKGAIAAAKADGSCTG